MAGASPAMPPQGVSAIQRKAKISVERRTTGAGPLRYSRRDHGGRSTSRDAPASSVAANLHQARVHANRSTLLPADPERALDRSGVLLTELET